MKLAIKLQDINALIDKYKRGEWVLWEELAKAAEDKLYSFNGVGRINSLGLKPINKENRYVHTVAELARLFGVTRQTLSEWKEAGFITLNRIVPPKNLKMKYSWVYDAKVVEKQIKKQFSKQVKQKSNKKE